MARLIGVVVAIVVAALGITEPGNAMALPAPTMPSHTYDARYDPTVQDGDLSERGPPSVYDENASYDADDRWSHGASACPDGPILVAVFDYDHPGALVQVARAMGTTEGRAQSADGSSFAFDQCGVAAETGTSVLESLSPSVQANVDDAIQRAASGTVRFPGHDGKVYNNSDNLLPPDGSYTEWTAAAAGEKRGPHRVIIEGNPTNPNAIYYWDHVNPPVQIGP